MGIIHLPITKIEFEVPDSIHYQDDGLVKSVIAHTSQLRKQYGLSEVYPLYIRAAEAIGLGALYRSLAERLNIPIVRGLHCINYEEPSSLDDVLMGKKEVFFHSYVLLGLDEETTIFLRGHEEFHLPVLLGKWDVLKESLWKVGMKFDNLERLPTEDVCYIGGLYALKINSPSGRI